MVRPGEEGQDIYDMTITPSGDFMYNPQLNPKEWSPLPSIVRDKKPCIGCDDPPQINKY